MPHLYGVQVPKELLDGKNLIAVVVREDVPHVFAGFLTIHVLGLPLVAGAVPFAALRFQPRPQCVFFALLAFDLWRRRAPPPA